MTVRSLLEDVLRPFVLKRHLPDTFSRAPLMVSTEGGLKYLFRSLAQVDPVLLWLAETFVKPGMIVWDVGANVGLFSVASAAKATSSGKVFSIEADNWMVNLLQKTMLSQPETSAPISILSVAASQEVGIATFNIAKRNRATNHLTGYGTTQAGGIRETHTVITISLDWLRERLPAPHVLKIDVEGAEVNVLEGAQKLLTETRPIVICEVLQTNYQRVTTIFKDLGYTLYDSDRLPDYTQPVDSATPNILATPTPVF